jgi:hypothetical protein
MIWAAASMPGPIAGITRNVELNVSGASRMTSRQPFITSAAPSTAKVSVPKTTPSSGCASNTKVVTTPKLPPPPRSAQNRSGFSSASAVTTSPDASTTSAPIRLSNARPY